MYVTAGIAVAFSVLVGLIEVHYLSKGHASPRFGFPSALYFLVLALGNAAASILVLTGVFGPFVKSVPPETASFYSAFVGVFGFQVLLRNTNVSLLGKGVLAIDTWVTKARDVAVADTNKRQATDELSRAVRLAEKLRTHESLNTLVLQILGPGKVQALEKQAQANNADAAHYKAMAVASKDPDRCEAFVGGKPKGLFGRRS